MTQSWLSRYAKNGLLGAFLIVQGCGGSDPVPPIPPAQSATPAPTPSVAEPAAPIAPVMRPEPATPVAPPVALPSISLSGKPSGIAAAGTKGASVAATPAAGAENRKAVLAAMDPLQIMLGQWRGTTQKEVGDFKGLDEPSWVWDFKTNRDQPELVLTSAASPYLREARLTYLPGQELFRLVAKDAEGKERLFEGKFATAAETYQGEDNRMHVKYKLELNQTNGTSPRDTWQVVFNQQENNRYLMELARQQGERFMRFDTVATQRQGTSFAKSDDDYGERTCIISGGLGTMQVSFMGKSYWVCCTGCQAAFEEDPKTWIAEFEAKQKQ